MGKRSDFKRRPQDAYDTPAIAVVPLVPHLPEDFTYWEPCAGKGDLVHALGRDACIWASDVEPRHSDVVCADALNERAPLAAKFIITNPPWSRPMLHDMILHFSAQKPTWLPFDADWVHTRQSEPFLPLLRKVVSVGRIKWIEGSAYAGKDNCSWHLFDASDTGPTKFVGRVRS